MDALGIRSRISPVRSLLLATLAGAVSFVATACADSLHDGHAERAIENERLKATRESDAGPVARPRSHSPDEFARLETAIRRFAGDRAGRLPLTLNDLVTERTPEGDHYLASIPTDAWGRPYSYGVVSARLGSYDLRSYGPDTLPGTDDDVVADAKPVSVH